MKTPSIWTLNLHATDWLIDEAARWQEITNAARGQDKADAQHYLDNVRLELVQHLEDKAKGAWGVMSGSVRNLFETVGGSSGGGAQGAAASAGDAVGRGVDSVAGAAKSIASIGVYVAGALAIGAIMLYSSKK